MVEVVRSTVVPAPIDRVWSVLRDFNSHHDWHPAVRESQIENGLRSDEVGCVRRFSLADGAELREQLLRLSDSDHSYTYCILDAPIPLYDYVATVTLKPVTDADATFWEWRSRFRTPPGQENQLALLVGESIYEAGFDALTARLTGSPIRSGNGPAAPVRLDCSDDRVCSGLVLQAFGGPENLKWGPVTASPPGPGEVRIEHQAIGLNYIDVYCRTGYFRLAEPPCPLGMEACGVVTDVGEGVDGILRGDRVAYACVPVGAYVEHRTMPAALLVVVPDEISSEQAAAVMLKGMTAEFLLHRVHRVRDGDVVLIHAAAGGVGQLLCQWARAIGAEVIGTVGSQDKVRVARDHGCSHPIVYGEENFVQRVGEITAGRGVDVVYDAVGRDTFVHSYDVLAERGHLVSYGQASGPIEPIDIAAFAAKSATVSRPNFGHYTSTPQQVRAITDRLFRALQQGILRVDIGQRFGLSDGAEAHRALESRQTRGSTVLIP